MNKKLAISVGTLMLIMAVLCTSCNFKIANDNATQDSDISSAVSDPNNASTEPDTQDSSNVESPSTEATYVDTLKQGENEDNFYLEVTIISEGVDITSYKMWVKGVNSRYDAGEGDTAFSLYKFVDIDSYYYYSKKINTIDKLITSVPGGSDKSLFDILNTSNPNFSEILLRQDDTVLDGIECTIFENTLTPGTIKRAYVSKKYNVMIKYDVIKDGKTTESSYEQDYKPGVVTDDDLAMPDDAENYDDLNSKDS